LLAIFLDFTGFVLRWDTGIQWALVVGTNLVRSIPLIGEGLYRVLLGGGELGQVSLTRFFAWHIFGITFFFLIILIWHLFRVRRDGGIAVPRAKARGAHSRIPRSELVRREILGMVFGGAVLVIVSLLFPAPISAPIKDISVVSGDAQAPWFFLWVQQMLKLGNPFVWGVLIPIVILLILGGTPYVFPRPDADDLGRWFPRSGRIAQVSFILITMLVIVLTILGWATPHAN
jgi:quinol-cytochrome oxidoreductase complex cytochrome b subunit